MINIVNLVGTGEFGGPERQKSELINMTGAARRYIEPLASQMLRVVLPPQDRPAVPGGPPANGGADASDDGASRADASGSVAQSTSGAPTAELLEELAGFSQQLEEAPPWEILRWAAHRYAGRFTMATAFGPEGMCLIHMLAEVAPETLVFNLDSGYQFPETLAMFDRVRQRYGLDVKRYAPNLSVQEYERQNEGPVHQRDPNRCCGERKLAVLRGAIQGMSAWASAIRRDQSDDRARAAIVGWDSKFGLVKVSPLANWTKNDVWKLITEHDIPYNPLHDQGYTSIGCWPCTRAVLFGEDERAGRWSGSAKTECGLHTDPGDSSHSR